MRRKRSEPKSHWQVEKERKQSKSILVIINYSCLFFYPPVEARTLGNPLGGVSGPPAGFRMADFQASTEQPGGRGDAEVQAGVGWLKAHHSLKA